VLRSDGKLNHRHYLPRNMSRFWDENFQDGHLFFSAPSRAKETNPPHLRSRNRIGVYSSYCTRGNVLSTGSSRQRRGTLVLSRRAGSSEISCRILSLVKKTLHRHRAGFEPQRASPFRKWAKAPQILGKADRAWAMIHLFLLPFTLLVVLTSSACGDL
jgi:hypothetical protein